MSTQITLRRDTRSHWTSVNPILDLAEIGLITDAEIYTIKIGDGFTVWNDLPEIYLQGEINTGGNALDVADLSTTPQPNTYYLCATYGLYSAFIDALQNPLSVSDGELCLFIPLNNEGTQWAKKTITNFYNFVHFYNLRRGYLSKETARGAVPLDLQMTGIVITYVLNGNQYTEQFIGGSYSTLDQYWQPFGVVNGAILYSEVQILTESQQNVALNNLGILQNINLWKALLSAGFIFMGVANTNTQPTTIQDQPTARLFYLSSGEGTYSLFRDAFNQSIEVGPGELRVFLTTNNGTSWTANTVISFDENISQYLEYLDSLLAGYAFYGFVTPASQVQTPNIKIYYIATNSGTYNQFGYVGGYQVSDKVVYFMWDTNQWVAQEIDILPYAVYQQQLAVVNVNWHNPGISIPDKVTARSLVPVQYQKQSIIISYVDTGGKTYCEIYVNSDGTYNTSDSYWVSLMEQGGTGSIQWEQI